MTAIAAISSDGKVWIGGDSAGVNTQTYCLIRRKDKKVFIKDKFIIGFTSSFRMGDILKYSFNPPKHPQKINDEEYMSTLFVDSIRQSLKEKGFSKIENNEETGGEFIVGYNGNIYQIHNDFQVGIPLSPYCAVGSGEELCLGSLYSTHITPLAPNERDPKKRIELALKCAEEHNATVRSPFTVLCL